MGTRFDAICDLIQADYATQNGAAHGVAWERGKLARWENSHEKRVVFVRDGGTIGPSKFTSSGESSPIVARSERVIAHIFARDDETAETILDNLIRSYDAVLGNAWEERAGEYDWATQGEEAGHEAFGTLIRFEAAWRLTVAERQPVTVILNDIDHVGSLGLGEFDGSFGNDFRFAGSPEIGC